VIESKSGGLKYQRIDTLERAASRDEMKRIKSVSEPGTPTTADSRGVARPDGDEQRGTVRPDRDSGPRTSAGRRVEPTARREEQAGGRAASSPGRRNGDGAGASVVALSLVDPLNGAAVWRGEDKHEGGHVSAAVLLGFDFDDVAMDRLHRRFRTLGPTQRSSPGSAHIGGARLR
jgi:hypothetical protein